MFKKIAFICANPLEKLLPTVSMGNVKEYYEWIYEQAVLLAEEPCCLNWIELYGNPPEKEMEELFLKDQRKLQLLYVQSHRRGLLEKVYETADKVLVGMSSNREECDRIFMTVFPWKEKSTFLWNNRISREPGFLKRIQAEYQLEENQIVQTKKLPFL